MRQLPTCIFGINVGHAWRFSKAAHTAFYYRDSFRHTIDLGPIAGESRKFPVAADSALLKIARFLFASDIARMKCVASACHNLRRNSPLELS